jgi:hypothetical protein
MTRYQDLSSCRYSHDALDADAWQVPLLTIGWLESPFPYDRGRTPPDFLPRLEALTHGAQRHDCGYHFLGFHTCSLCVATLREPPAQPWSQSCLWVPGNGVVYVAPVGVTHYVAVHSYLPPLEFIEAVMRCPEYGSPAFEAALTEANAGVLPPLLAEPWPAATGDGVSFVDLILVTAAIADYLQHHPDAADTVEGIANGWLAGDYARPAVERALSELVQRRVLHARIGPDGSAVYSAARQSSPG